MNYINRFLDPPAAGWVLSMGNALQKTEGREIVMVQGLFLSLLEAKACIILKKDSVPFTGASMRLFPSIFQ